MANGLRRRLRATKAPLPTRDRFLIGGIRFVRRLQKGSYTAGSAVVCFSEDRREVLLVRVPYMSSPIFPGGFKDRHETAEDAARRELAEELSGLGVIDLELAGLRIQDGRRHIDVIFVAILLDSMRDHELRAKSREIRSVDWRPLDVALSELNADGAAILRSALDAVELRQLPWSTT